MHIDDKDFIRGEVPMTKQEVRAVSIGKLHLKKDSLLIDVGAGTGSIGIEASTYLEKGRVIAIEKNPLGIELIKKNIEKFNINNLDIIFGYAPEDLNIKNFDRMFVGGSSKNMRGIIDYFLKYSKDESIVVINVIALESLNETLEILREKNLKDMEIVNITVARDKKIGNYTMMTGENPIYIISARK